MTFRRCKTCAANLLKEGFCAHKGGVDETILPAISHTTTLGGVLKKLCERRRGKKKGSEEKRSPNLFNGEKVDKK